MGTHPLKHQPITDFSRNITTGITGSTTRNIKKKKKRKD